MPRLGAPRYPRNWTAFADEFWAFDYDTFSATRTGSQNHSIFWVLNRATPGAYMQKYVFLGAGDYYLYILGVMAANAGMVSWTLDGVVIASDQDWYAVATAYNIIYPVLFTMPCSGWSLLKVQVTGQNAMSSGYRLNMTKVYMIVPDEG